MPYIRQIPRKGSPSWELTWYDDEGKHYATFPTEEAAKDFIAKTPHRKGNGGGKGRTLPLEQRIRRMSKAQANGCWQWQGRPTNAGYGQMGVLVDGKQRTFSAHRVSYEVFVGEIPNGLVIDHLCRNRLCVNPDHLEAVTQQENVMRSPIAIGAINARKTHCPQGHPYDDENTYVLRLPNTTSRYCRTCMSSRRRNEAKELSR